MAKFDSTLLPENEKDRRVALDLLDKINKLGESVDALDAAAGESYGGIYKSGSNANGYYIQYVDGTMEQWGWGCVLCAGGAGSYSTTLTLPQPFVDSSFILASNVLGTSTGIPSSPSGATPAGGPWVSTTNIPGSVTQFTLTARYTTAFGSANYYTSASWHAIGKWTRTRAVDPSPVQVTSLSMQAIVEAVWPDYTRATSFNRGSVAPKNGWVFIGTEHYTTAPVVYVNGIPVAYGNAYTTERMTGSWLIPVRTGDVVTWTATDQSNSRFFPCRGEP